MHSLPQEKKLHKRKWAILSAYTGSCSAAQAYASKLRSKPALLKVYNGTTLRVEEFNRGQWKIAPLSFHSGYLDLQDVATSPDCIMLIITLSLKLVFIYLQTSKCLKNMI